MDNPLTGPPNVGPIERGASIVTGGALLFAATRRPTGTAVPLALSGAYLLARGAFGHCAVYDALGIDAAHGRPAVEQVVRSTFTIGRPRADVWAFWSNLSNLPRAMRHIESVEVEDGRSHWRAVAPGGLALEWDAETVDTVEGELIAWRSLPGSRVVTYGEVRFKDAPRNRGTELQVGLVYGPPGGGPGALFARLFNPATAQLIREDLRRVKQLLETGEIATTSGQPSGREERPS